MARFREGTGTALLVAIGSFSVFAILAWLVAVLLWIALSVYALVEMIGDGRPSAVAVLLIVVLLVGTLVTLAAVGFGFVGKRLTPGKRDRG
jgi:cation transporter-like permease